MHHVIYTSPQPYEIFVIIIIPILQVGKLRFKEMKKLA